MLRIALTFVVGLLTTGLFAQSGIIRGKVTSGETGEELIGAAVYIAGTTKGSSTDLEGNYSILSVEPGKYDIVCQYISFANDTIKGVVVGEDVTITNFALGSSNINLEEFVVEAKANRASENFMLTMQKKAAGVMDGISSQQIARSGDGNAAAAARRVTGVSIEGGKYVYVRGLSDRYSLTTLNEAEIPSLDPERNSVQMDLIPTNLIDNMQVYKSFTPDKPASYTGGLVNIGTKDFPERYTFQLSTNFGFNTVSSFNENFQTTEKSPTFFTTYGSSEHEAPITTKVEGLGGDREKHSAQTKLFSKEYNPTKQRSMFNHGLSVSVGDQSPIEGKPDKSIGYIGGVTYNRSYGFQEDLVRGNYELAANENATNSLSRNRLYSGSRSQESVILGALANVSYKLNRNNKVGLNLMLNRNAQNTVRLLSGENTESDPGLTQVERKLQYQERSLFLTQLKGEHYLESSAWKIDWLLSATKSGQNEPRLRYFINDYEVINGDTVYDIQASKYSLPTQFWREMDEYTFHNKVDFTKDFELVEGLDGKVKFGLSAVNKDRAFLTRSYQFKMTTNMRNRFNDEYNGDVDSFMADGNMNVGDTAGYIYVVDNTAIRNSYDANSGIYAAYGMYDGYVTPVLRVVAGARLEITQIEVASRDLDLKRGVLDNTDVLPVLNLSYQLAENQNFRFGYTRTLARPSFREITPFASFGGGSDFTVVGNPDLVRTTVDNLDLRYELFMRPGEMVAASVFGKKFKNPIEKVFSKEANNELSWSNVPGAILYGLELEARKSLDFIGERIKDFSIGGNLTLIKSKVDLSDDELVFIKDIRPSAGDTRELFGQAPYIVNAFLNYNNADKGLKANLSFNVSGEKIAVVGRKGSPHIYDQPRPTLDFNIGKVFNEKFSMKFAAKNLMNAKVNWEMHFKDVDYQTNAYSLGRTYSIGFSYFIN